MALLVLAVVLAVVVVAQAVGLVVLAGRWRQERARADRLEASLLEVEPRPGAAALAGRAVRAVTTTASRLRSGGVAGLLSESLDDLERWAREDRTKIVRVAGPDGSVTVVFTDIVDSTRLNEQLGDERWLRVLAAHEHEVRAAVERRGGHVVKNQGDGFMIVFGEPDDAVAAAVDLQQRSESPSHRQLRRVQVPVRIGLHTGRVVSRDGDFFGRNVAVAARVAALADAGDILATGDVIAALGDEVPAQSLGPRELKGIAETVDVYTVDWRDS